MVNYTIIVPIFNENEKVKILLNELDGFKKDFEIIIVDDGSDDGTTEKISGSKDIIFIKK